MQVLLVSNDLMVRSLVEGAARRASAQLAVAGAASEALERCRHAAGVVLVDLQLADLDISELVAAVRQSADNPTIIGFAPHVHEATLQAALDHGCDEVVSRGGLDRQIDELLMRGGAAD